jgi:hypothetical protein
MMIRKKMIVAYFQVTAKTKTKNTTTTVVK